LYLSPRVPCKDQRRDALGPKRECGSVEIVTNHPGFTAEDKALVLEGNARRLLGL
jgi:hypothetical protein